MARTTRPVGSARGPRCGLGVAPRATLANSLSVRPGQAAQTRTPRVLAPPHATKPAIELKLCTAAGVELRAVPRRDKPAYAKARRLGWGDAL